MTRGTNRFTGGILRAPEVDRAGAGAATTDFTPIWEVVDNENLKRLPRHLKRFVVDQQYDKYTSIDHAVWRYVMRQNFAFLKDHAHESYTEGLRRTGIGIEKIPSVYEMNDILSRIGWACVTVDGFIPPAAFMEYQAFRVLVIAADMRQINHIEYTPAPDIIHEAAGHAPIIADEEYAEYLRRIGEVGAKAMSSKKDYELYEAIRHLSILKELHDPDPNEVAAAEKAVEDGQANLGKPSEMALLSRLHWWTVEYGLVGTLEDPKIYGAGLLSSIGESANCVTPKVKKLPYNLETANYAFDITTQQPHLFVTPDFRHLIDVLEEFADGMAFRTGGKSGLNKAIECANVSTAVYSSGLQVSGVFTGLTVDEHNRPIYIKTTGPTALAVDDKQLDGHGKTYHADGFGSPVGKLRGIGQPIEKMTNGDLASHGIEPGKRVALTFESGITVDGMLERVERANGKVILLVFSDCTAKNGDTTLFDPAWGTYDMAVGVEIVSVFCNAADKDAYEQPSLVPKERTVKVDYDDKTRAWQKLYAGIRSYREENKTDESIVSFYTALRTDHPKDWLGLLEILEILTSRGLFTETAKKIRAELQTKAEAHEHLRKLIHDGLRLVDNPIKKV
ncbi:aromatic amino acid hydroxylase [bacterium]|nr:aromatic amino acid hydroxylase [bacterium]MCB2202319.1 aromatic amino acid hydroxylase [bacterium]